ncbi:MAG: adenylate/guanylate cyclase domain-containing protein [Phycisphaerae bacterium]|nr:adenylate/guanylate cyclase domain-containing protein [Phycisphaerae bacterium]
MTTDRDSPTAYLEDRPVLTRVQAWVLGVVAPLVIAVLGVWITGHGSFERLEGVTIDWRFRARGPRQPPEHIVIVEIDERSRRALRHGDQRFNLREHLATAVDNLADAGALVVGLDVWLEDSATREIDARLAKALASANVVLAVAHTEGKTKRASSVFLESEPQEGTVTVYPDAGNVLRRLPEKLFLDAPRKGRETDALDTIPHFPLALALYAVLEEDETARIRFEDGVARIGSYSAYPRELIDFSAVQRHGPGEGPRWKTLRLEDVVRGSFDAEAVDGSVIVLGDGRTLEDAFVLPLSDDLQPGIYYHANAVAHILGRRHFNTTWAGGRRGQLLIAALAFAAGLFAWNQRQWWRHRWSTVLLLGYFLTGVIVFLGGWAYLTFSIFEQNVLLPVVAPLAAMGISLASGLAAQWVVLSENARRLAQRTRQIEALFGQSVSQSVLQALKRSPERIRRTETRDVSVLFCDLRDFTEQTSKMEPADVAAMLNEYFNYIAEAVFEHDGFIDKFVGDEVMAVFAVPFDQPDHPARAVRTAIAIKRRLAELNRVREARGQAPLNCGLGIHCGPAAAGHIGSRQRSNYTVVGTTVNLAARIEHYTKGGEILVSDAVRRKLPPEIRVHLWDKVEIRGASGLHELYEVKVNGVDS